jgi:hypothetical protein
MSDPIAIFIFLQHCSPPMYFHLEYALNSPKASTLSMRKLSLILVSLFSFACSKSEQSPPILDSGGNSLSTGTFTVHTLLTQTRDSSAHPIDTTSTFSPKDTIHGVIHSENAKEGTTILGRWYYVSSGEEVAENTARLSSGPNISYFDLMNETPWPQGKYKLLVMVNNVVVDSAEFSVANKQ